MISILAADFVSAEPGRTILSIMQGVKYWNVWKTMERLTFFVNFWLNQIQKFSAQDEIFSFQLKKTTFTER